MNNIKQTLQDLQAKAKQQLSPAIEIIKKATCWTWNKMKALARRLWHLKWQWKLVLLLSPIVLLMGGVWLFVTAVDGNWLGWFGSSPKSEQLENPMQVEASEIYSADGVLIGKFFTENRSLVEFEDISPVLIETLIHTEDERFYEHNGVDYPGLLGALKDGLTGNARGASTLSQQLVKNLFKIRTDYMDGKLCRNRFLRTPIIKAKECIGARRIEDRYTKRQILTMYLNTVYFGSNAYGIKAAAKTYFNTTPAKLNREQSACLVGILKANTYYNPKKNPENNLKRRNVILRNMQQHGVLEKEECDSLCNLPLLLNYSPESNLNGRALHFRDAVCNELQAWCDEQGLDLYQDGLKIHTTIDSRMQAYAEQAVKRQMAELQRKFDRDWGRDNPWRDRNNRELKTFIDERLAQTDAYKALLLANNGDKAAALKALRAPHKMQVFDYRHGMKDTVMSTLDSLKHALRYLHCGFVAMEPQTGHVKAWVGDVDYNYWQYDKVTSKRQPGSTFKLFVYTEAMRKGCAPCDIRTDSAVNWTYRDKEQGKWMTWQPRNANGEFSNENMTLKTAFARSINSVAAQLMRELGPESVMNTAKKMGITSPLKANPALCLGSEDVSLLEMVTAYSVIMDDGRKHAPVLVTRVEDKNGHTLLKNNVTTEEALDYETAFLMREMLREGLADEKGTSQGLKNYNIFQHTDFGGKTGSTSNYSDAWYIGVTPKLVAGAWVGGEYRCIHFRNGAEGQGGRAALPIFGRFMEKTLNDKSLKQYRGKFGEPKQEITKQYDCTGVDLDNENGAGGFFKRLFGKKDSDVAQDTTPSRREMRRRERKQRREEERLRKEQEKAEKAASGEAPKKKKWWRRNKE